MPGPIGFNDNRMVDVCRSEFVRYLAQRGLIGHTENNHVGAWRVPLASGSGRVCNLRCLDSRWEVLPNNQVLGEGLTVNRGS